MINSCFSKRKRADSIVDVNKETYTITVILRSSDHEMAEISMVCCTGNQDPNVIQG